MNDYWWAITTFVVTKPPLCLTKNVASIETRQDQNYPANGNYSFSDVQLIVQECESNSSQMIWAVDLRIVGRILLDHWDITDCSCLGASL